MKKKFILLPITLTTLMPITIPLASCNKGPDIKVPTFTIAETTMSNRKEDYIQLNWVEESDSIEVGSFTFSYGDGTNSVGVEEKSEVGARPFNLKLTFTNDVIDNIVDGVLNFHYKDITTKSEGDTSVRNIKINAIEWGDEQAHIIDDDGVTHLVTSLTESKICGESGDITCDDQTKYARNLFNFELKLNPNLTSIGDNFLFLCGDFNKELTLPDNLESIGNQFLKNCYAFNQSLTLPDNLTSIGNDFLHNAKDMTSIIYMQNLEVSVFKGDMPKTVLSTSIKDASMYQTGIEIVGKHKAEFLAAFPNLTEAPHYRKLK